MNLSVLSKSRHVQKIGDIFALRPSDGLYLFGRVIDTNANPLGVGTAILVYIYRTSSESKTAPPFLDKNQLLIPPLMTNRLPWVKGYFEYLEHRELPEEAKFPVHCFRDTRGWYFNERGERMEHPIEPVGHWGLDSYRTIDDAISTALGIPLAPN